MHYENYEKANCLLYADDIALLSKSQDEMNTLLKIASGVAQRKNFSFNIEKWAYVGYDKVNLWLCGRKIEKVEEFVYLGIKFDKKGINNMSHINELKQKIARTMTFFKRIRVNGKGYRLGCKVTLYKSFIRSRIEYGLAIMDVNKKEQKLIEQMQYELMCQLFSVNKKTSYKPLQAITGIASMELRINILKAKWVLRYTHIKEDEKLLVPKIENWCNSLGMMTIINKLTLASSSELTQDNYKVELKVYMIAILNPY